MPSPVPDESASYLSKARPNLAVSDLARDAGHYDAAANRAYYAAFQAAVAALWVEGIRAPADSLGTLSHGMVQSEWAGRLIYRRKLYPPELRASLVQLYKVRVKADYEVTSVSRREARRACEESRRLVDAVLIRLRQNGAEHPER
jgi:uncharacterized protein (UPF0332 family)